MRMAQNVLPRVMQKNESSHGHIADYMWVRNELCILCLIVDMDKARYLGHLESAQFERLIKAKVNHVWYLHHNNFCTTTTLYSKSIGSSGIPHAVSSSQSHPGTIRIAQIESHVLNKIAIIP